MEGNSTVKANPPPATPDEATSPPVEVFVVRAVWLAVVLVSAVSHAGTPDAKARALRLYQQKHYDEACPLFEAMAKEAKTDGAAWADLGLCEAKRGNPEVANRASLLAVRYGDEATRKAAYFNLFKAGHRVALPEAKERDALTCATLPTAPVFECAKSLWACTWQWFQYGTGAGSEGASAIFGFSEEERAELMQVDPSDHTALMDRERVTVSSEEEILCGYCVAHAWDCLNSKVVNASADECYRKLTGRKPTTDLCGGGADSAACHDYMACFDAQCAKAKDAAGEPSIWPKAAAEIAREMKKCDDCGIQSTTNCVVVAVDPCAGRVGYVCTTEKPGKKAAKPEVKELVLEGAP